MSHKTCILCTHMSLTTGEPALSDVTPGTDLSMACAKNHWRFDSMETSMEQYRMMMQQAQTCQDFRRYDSTPVRISLLDIPKGDRRNTGEVVSFLKGLCGMTIAQARASVNLIKDGHPVDATVQRDKDFVDGVVRMWQQYYKGYKLERT